VRRGHTWPGPPDYIDVGSFRRVWRARYTPPIVLGGVESRDASKRETDEEGERKREKESGGLVSQAAINKSAEKSNR
jgi:hypothetical protein